jgi:hypothetical protein
VVLKCDTTTVTAQAGVATAALTSVGPVPASSVMTGPLHVDSLIHMHAGGTTSAALHGGRFTYVLSTGDHVEGLVSGLTNVNPHRPGAAQAAPRHLEGVLKGVVVSGRLQGCELRAVFTADYTGTSLVKAPARWTVAGALVCPCAVGIGGGGPTGIATPVTADVPGWVRDSLQRQITRDSVIRARRLDSVLARQARDVRLRATDRELADIDRNGRTTAIETLEFADRRKAFAAIDVNGDGSVTRQEFEQANVKQMLKVTRPWADEFNRKPPAVTRLEDGKLVLMRNADVDKSGQVTEEELDRWVREGLRRQIAEMDTNRNGRVSFAEYFKGAKGSIAR